MIYGNILGSTGTILTNFAYSNNFDIYRKTTGTYVLTPRIYSTNTPTLSVTPTQPGSTKATASMVWATSNNVSVCNIYLYNGGSLADMSFIVHGKWGSSWVFDAMAQTNHTLTLNCDTVSFKGQDVLRIHTSIAGIGSYGQASKYDSCTANLDIGTMLMGTYAGGGTLKLQLPKSFTSGTTYTLSGYTYGGDSGVGGTAWQANSTGPYYDLTVGTSTLTTPESFVVVATAGAKTLTSDPIVRLSSVPPPGFILAGGTISSNAGALSWSRSSSQTSLAYTNQPQIVVTNNFDSTVYYWSGTGNAPSSGVQSIINTRNQTFQEPAASGSNHWSFATSSASGTRPALTLTLTRSS